MKTDITPVEVPPKPVGGYTRSQVIQTNKKLRKRGLRLCGRRGEVKPLDIFHWYSNTRNANGFQSECITCWLARDRADYLKRKEAA